jgi:oxygen-independent coproporphyrinogen-3 oxidase
MAGIYIHVPFCRQACSYCDFHFSTSPRYQEEYVQALRRELEIRATEIDASSLETLYFGGGTPSRLSLSQLERIFETLHRCFPRVSWKETSFEANPDDCHPDYLKGLKSLGIDRLSLGIQSFRDVDLQHMHRAHNAAEARDCISKGMQAGFQAFSVDLIYGIPGMTDADWVSNLEQAAQFPIQHLSCYALTVEQGTPLEKHIRKGLQSAPQDEDAERHFRILQRWAPERGFEHYEISNLARQGARARHNSAYWDGSPYYGFGPAAHSFVFPKRSENVRNNQRYIRSVHAGYPEQESEILEPESHYNELVLTGLRTLSGLRKARLEALPPVFLQFWLKQWKKSPYVNQIRDNGDAWVLDPALWFRADGIAASLFWDSCEAP